MLNAILVAITITAGVVGMHGCAYAPLEGFLFTARRRGSRRPPASGRT